MSDASPPKNKLPVAALLPGLAAAAAIVAAALAVHALLGRVLPWEKNPVSAILIAMILGLAVRNLLPTPQTFTPGIQFGIKKLLRFGIILMGIRLSIIAVARVGVMALAMVACCIVAGLVVTVLLARTIRIGPRLGALIAAGTSICGVSAIVAVSPTIDASEEETAYAIGTITLFGLLATIVYPYATELVLQLDPAQAGFFLGTAVHDTSQVTATALIYDQLWGVHETGRLAGADVAITTKLVRNTFLVVVVPLLGCLFGAKSREAGCRKIPLLNYVPLFVFGYVLMAGARTLGDCIFGDETAAWLQSWHAVKSAAFYVIAAAIACVGLNTDIRKMAHLGFRPFVCGFAAALTVGAVSFWLVTVLGKWVAAG